MSTTTLDIVISGLMGLMGGLITIPINTYFALRLKRDEIAYQHKFNLAQKEKELLLQHRLEMKLLERKTELENKPPSDQINLAERVTVLEDLIQGMLGNQNE